MDEKRWTLAELTAEAERQIVRSVSEAEADLNEGTKQMKRDWAYGAYFMWLALADKVATDEEKARLKALIQHTARK
jgi:hypothetical protein